MAETPRNAIDPIFELAEKQPDAPALVEHSRTLSRGEMTKLIRWATWHLKDLGIAAGDVIGVRMTNSIDHFVLSLALMRMGATLVEVPVERRQGLSNLATSLDMKAIFREPNFPEWAGVRSVPIRIGWADSLKGKKGEVRHDNEAHDAQVLRLSLGSTGGAPKAVTTPHSTLLARHGAMQQTFGESGLFSADGTGTFALTAGISFSALHAFALFSLMSGMPVTIVPEPRWPMDLVRALEQIDDVVAVVTAGMCRAFLHNAPKDRLLFPNARALINAGLPLPHAEKRSILERVTPKLYETYSSTSAGTISVLAPEEIDVQGATAGRLIPEMEGQVVDNKGTELPAGTAGILRLRGPLIAPGFHRENDGQRQGGTVFRDGWYYPGDLAAIDENGYLHLRGRISDTVMRNEMPVLLTEIEAAFRTHDKILDVAAIGVETVDGKKLVIALAVTSQRPEKGELVQHCTSQLSQTQRPDSIILVDALPRTPQGRLDRRKVAELARQLLKTARPT